MPNYFVINSSSNLITHVMASSYTPSDTRLLRFVKANDSALNAYYKWCKKNPGMCMDIGELMAKSAYITDQVGRGKAGGAKPTSPRIRELPQAKPQSREEEVKIWIAHHPTADAYDLDAALYTGILAARAYLLNYNL